MGSSDERIPGQSAHEERTVTLPLLIENRGAPIPQWDPERIVSEADTLVDKLESIALPEDFELEDFTRALRVMFQPTVTEKLHFLLGNVERFKKREEPAEYAAVIRACDAWVKKYNHLRRAFRAYLKKEDRAGQPVSDQKKEEVYRYIRPLRVFRTRRLRMIHKRIAET